MQVPGERRRVVAVAALDRRQCCRARRNPIEPLLRREDRHVRQAEADGQEEGLVAGHAANLLDRGVGDPVVAVVLVARRERAPVHHRCQTGRRFQRQHAARHSRGRPRTRRGLDPFLELTLAELRFEDVEDLADGDRLVAALGEVAGQRDMVAQLGIIGQRGSHRRLECVDAGGRWPKPGQEAGPRRVAERGLDVRAREVGATPGDGIERRRGGLRMALGWSRPVVEVVEHDEQHVRRPWRRSRGAASLLRQRPVGVQAEHGQAAGDERDGEPRAAACTCHTKSPFVRARSVAPPTPRVTPSPPPRMVALSTDHRTKQKPGKDILRALPLTDTRDG